MQNSSYLLCRTQEHRFLVPDEPLEHESQETKSNPQLHVISLRVGTGWLGVCWLIWVWMLASRLARCHLRGSVSSATEWRWCPLGNGDWEVNLDALLSKRTLILFRELLTQDQLRGHGTCSGAQVSCSDPSVLCSVFCYHHLEIVNVFIFELVICKEIWDSGVCMWAEEIWHAMPPPSNFCGNSTEWFYGLILPWCWWLVAFRPGMPLKSDPCEAFWRLLGEFRLLLPELILLPSFCNSKHEANI